MVSGLLRRCNYPMATYRPINTAFPTALYHCRPCRWLGTATTTRLLDADVIVVGGGIIGTSVAYHLAKLDVNNVMLLERDKLTSGTTWHAAGLINTFGSLSATSTKMRMVRTLLYCIVQ